MSSLSCLNIVMIISFESVVLKFFKIVLTGVPYYRISDFWRKHILDFHITFVSALELVYLRLFG